jgi:hypothetical protein
MPCTALLGWFVSSNFHRRRNGHLQISWYVPSTILPSYYVSISIIGSGFTILGGRRPGYGPFSLSLDGRQLYDGNPVPDSSPINNTLAVVSGFPYDDHTLVLTNSGGAPVDIDTITFETETGSAGCVCPTSSIIAI